MRLGAHADPPAPVPRADPAAAGTGSGVTDRSDGRYRNPHRGLRHRRHRSVRVRRRSPPNCCRSAATASPARASDSVAGIRRSRCTSTPRRSTIPPGCATPASPASTSHCWPIPTPRGDSQLPAGVVEINRRNYLMVTTTKDLEPQTSRLVTAEPARAGWQTVPGSRRVASYQDGSQTQISGYYDPIPTTDSPSGWVYIVANSFTRRHPVVLYRATPQTFTDRSRWQGWAAGPGGGWNKPPDTALARPGGRDVHPADRRPGGAVVFQRQHRQHGGPGGQRTRRCWATRR